MVLWGTALAAFAWCIARAHLQSITIDEADTYLAFVAPPYPAYWQASVNNHVLNSMLMTLGVTLFGATHLAVRTAALLGAATYMAAACILVRRIGGGVARQWLLLVCLICNPFVVDYLVAARGYSLALGLLLAMLAVTACAGSGAPLRSGVAVSLLGGLAFLAQFSFAVVAAAVVSVGLVQAWRRGSAPAWRLAAAYLVPGAALAAILAGPLLLVWPKEESIFGCRSLIEMIRSVVDFSIAEPNPYLLHPLLLRVVKPAGVILYPLLALAMLARFRVRAPLAGMLAAVISLTMAVHWSALQLAGLLLPKERTALFLVPLFVLLAGALAAPPAGRWTRGALTVALLLVACYSLLCVRLTWFKQWEWGADGRQVYSMLAWYNHHRGVKDVATEWRYAAALNFYRTVSGAEDLRKFEPSLPSRLPDSAQAWVLYWPESEGFIGTHGLKVVYRGERTQTVVAIRPDVEAR